MPRQEHLHCSWLGKQRRRLRVILLPWPASCPAGKPKKKSISCVLNYSSFSQHLISALCGLERGKSRTKGFLSSTEICVGPVSAGRDGALCPTCLRADGLLNQTELGLCQDFTPSYTPGKPCGEKKPGFIPHPEQLLPGQPPRVLFLGAFSCVGLWCLTGVKAFPWFGNFCPMSLWI